MYICMFVYIYVLKMACTQRNERTHGKPPGKATRNIAVRYDPLTTNNIDNGMRAGGGGGRNEQQPADGDDGDASDNENTDICKHTQDNTPKRWLRRRRRRWRRQWRRRMLTQTTATNANDTAHLKAAGTICTAKT